MVCVSLACDLNTWIMTLIVFFICSLIILISSWRHSREYQNTAHTIHRNPKT